jgi:hypothetical protein
MQPAIKAQEQEQPQLVAAGGRHGKRHMRRRCSAELAAGGGGASPLEPQKEHRQGTRADFSARLTGISAPPGISRRKGHTSANFGLKTSRCVLTPLSARLAQMDSPHAPHSHHTTASAAAAGAGAACRAAALALARPRPPARGGSRYWRMLHKGATHESAVICVSCLLLLLPAAYLHTRKSPSDPDYKLQTTKGKS